MPAPDVPAILRRALVAVLFNAVLAVFITAVSGESLAINMLYSQCIGLCIWAGIDGGRFLLDPSGWPGAWRMAALVVVAVLASYFLGSLVSNLLLGREALKGLAGLPTATYGFLLMSLAAGGFGAYFFTSREQLARARLAEQAAQRQASEARLRLLETQLEPHMLFNTLANLRALITTDPPRAVAMLDRLNGYLRATLAASRTDARAGTHALRDEFARLRDYLELMAVRMGPRLHVALVLPDALADHPVPVLLLQPLVENAIRHGLEPAAAGGHIEVSAALQDRQLMLTVQDTGVGCADEPRHGFGLAQVRERLHTAFGTQARCVWHSAPGQGTRVTLHLPLNGARQP